MRATLNMPPSARLVEAALEGLVQLNRVLIETGTVPPSPLDTRVRYKRERSGLEEWDNAWACLKRGWGDCEDLNAWECARINLDEDPEAVCALIQTGPKLFHCVVQLSDGSYRDVCPSLGMKVPGTSLEGLPWLDVEVGKGYVPKRSGRTDTRSQAQKRWDRDRKRYPSYQTNTQRPGEAYQAKGSVREAADPYEPKSSRASREAQSTRTQDRDEAVDAMVSPTSTSSPQAMQAVPMQDYSADAYEEAMDLAEPAIDEWPAEESEESLEEMEAAS